MLQAITPSFLSSVPQGQLTQLTPANAKWLVDAVRQSREDHAALDMAIRQHEAGSLPSTPSSTPTKATVKLLGGRSGGSRSRGMGPGQKINKRDLKLKPLSQTPPTKIPKNIASMMTWDEIRFDVSTNTSTGGIVEFNRSFNLLDNPQSGNWIALFDQWCIVQVTVTHRSLQPPGSGGSPAELYTAIDFDSVTNLGSITAIENFGNCEVNTISTGKSVTLSVVPMIKLSTQQPSTNVNSSLARMWQDSGASGTPHFGLRAIASSVSSVYAINSTYIVTYCFRDSI